jgi:hypothetical protein
MEQSVKKRRFSSVPVTTLSRSQPPNGNGLRHDLCYKPLFAHHSSSEDDEMSLDDSTSQVSYAPADDSGTGPASNGARAMGKRSQSGSSSKRKRDDGAMVFYSGAPFCTDLSGDRENISTPLHVSNTDIDGFSNHIHDALGCKPRRPIRPLTSRTPSGSTLPFRPFKDYSVCVSPLLGNEARSRIPDIVKLDDDDSLGFSPPWTSTGEQENLDLKRLEACGLGGTRPADHFAVIVETKRKKLDRRTRLRLSKFSPSRLRSSTFQHVIPQSSLELFRSSTTGKRISSRLPQIRDNSAELARFPNPEELPLEPEILSTRVEYLKPSDLPPPGTYHGTFSSSNEWSDDSSSQEDREEVPNFRQRPQFLARTLNSASQYDPMDLDESNGNNETSELGESDTSSIDMLAQARDHDLVAVAVPEREFEYEEKTPLRLPK